MSRSGGSGKTRERKALTKIAIETARPSDEPYRVPDEKCAGLALRVAPSGLKTWDVSFRIRKGKVKRVSLGSIADTSLEQARNRTHALAGAARLGRDLIAEEEESRAALLARPTLGHLIDEYVRLRVVGRIRTAVELERRLHRTFAPMVEKHADDVQRRDVRQLLDAVAEQGMVREAEHRRHAARGLFRWAASQDIIKVDPTAGLTAYSVGTTVDRVLSRDEINTLWRWLGGDAMPEGVADVLRLQLLLGARVGEVAGLRAEEIDRERRVWTLPAERSKNGKQRVTPLVGAAWAIIEARLARTGAGLFFTASTGQVLTGSHLGHYLTNRELPIAKFTTHDLRRTVASMLAEMGIALELVAMVIGHEAGGKEARTLVRHYIRTDLLDRKRAVLEAWNGRVAEMISGAVAGSNVVPIKATA